MTTARKIEIEPGLLTLFRLSLLLRLGYLFFIMEDYFEILSSASRLEVFLVLYLGEVLGLLLYLSLPGLSKRLGRAYLPLALGINLVLPAIEMGMLVPFPISTPGDSVSLQLLSIWLMPLILTSWQYSLRQVALFCLATLVLSMTINGAAGQPLQWDSNLHESIGRTLLYGLVGYSVFHLMQMQRSQRQELRQANQKLAAHALTLEQLTVSRERNRLARELHDTLAHTLSSAAVQLDSALVRWPQMPTEANTRLEATLTTLRAGLDETRRALQALRATPLTDLGLVLALRSLTEDWNARHSFALAADLPETVENVPEEVEHTFYRVVQEALDNIYRHANAHHASLCLKQANGLLILSITDDGEGFTPNTMENSSRMGLQGMRERAEMIGAQFTLTSTPDKGTQIYLQWKEPS